MLLRLVLVSCAAVARAHIALWDAGMYGLNYPYQADDASNINWNNNAPVNPLRELDALSEAQWFGHGFIGYPPADGNFMTLPAGGVYHGEHGCNRAETSQRDPSISDPLPYYACPDGSGSSGVGALHTMNRYNASFDASWQGGAALAIAYTSDPTTLQPNDLTVISINQTAVWARAVDYQIPAGMPPCPTGGCLCTWNWIHEANHGEGYPFEIYNVLYRCQVTGSTDASKTVQRGSVPIDCTSNSAACITGPKTPMYIYQYTGNNIAHLYTPPNYKSTWGFNDGAQNDIFVPATAPAPTTYIVNPYATPTGTAAPAGTPTATALPSGWVSYGCSTDQDSPRVLNGPLSTSSNNNTISGCTSSCASQGYTWAGVEYGQECWCGTEALINPTNSSKCNVPCSGDPWANCGGSYAIEVFFGPSTAAPVPDATTIPSDWSALGCFTDQDSPRTLNGEYHSSPNNTWTSCISTCIDSNYTYAGVEYGQECWCANTLNTSRSVTSGCDVPCAGDNAVTCGGGYHIQVFGANPSTTTTASGTATTTATVNATMTSANATTTMTSTPINSTAATSPATASTTAMSLNTQNATSTLQVNTTSSTTNATAPSMPTTTAVNTTSVLTTATVNSTVSTTSTRTTATVATTPLTTPAVTTTPKSISTSTSTAAPSSTVALPSGWSALGCNVDAPNRLLPTYLGASKKNTAATCIERCALLGFKYAGTEWGEQCFCANTVKLNPATSGCTSACSGNGKELCGGSYRISVYGVTPQPTVCRMSVVQQVLYRLKLIANPCP